MPLHYLHFDASDNTEGLTTFDAMASVTPRYLPALQAEIAQVLAWAYHQHPDGPGPLEEGHPWDLDLQASTERSTRERLRYDPATARLISEPLHGSEVLRHTVTVSIAANEAFAQAFVTRFEVGRADS